VAGLEVAEELGVVAAVEELWLLELPQAEIARARASGRRALRTARKETTSRR